MYVFLVIVNILLLFKSVLLCQCIHFIWPSLLFIAFTLILRYISVCIGKMYFILTDLDVPYESLPLE